MNAVENISAASVEGLTVRYGGKTALFGVTFSVPRGSVYALLGRNGAGKSSLLRCLLGQQKPQAGRAALFGEDAWRRRAALMARTAWFPKSRTFPRR